MVPISKGEVKILAALEELDAFIEGLSPLDKMNFKAVLTLPKPEAVIAACPDAEWQKQWVTALGLRRANEQELETANVGR